MRHAISFARLGATPALLGCGTLDRATDVATGYVSHQLCSAAFVSRVEPEQFYREAIAPVSGAHGLPVRPSGRPRPHRGDRELRGVAQAAPSTAARGLPVCGRATGARRPAAAHARPGAPARHRRPVCRRARPPALKQALDRAFAENASPPDRNTKAVASCATAASSPSAMPRATASTPRSWAGRPPSPSPTP